MSASFPTTIDPAGPSHAVLISGTLNDADHADLHVHQDDMARALEAQQGVTGSADTSTHEYKINHQLTVTHDMSVDPGLGYYPVTQPTGKEHYSPSIITGPPHLLQYTAASTDTDNNHRVFLPDGAAGVWGDTEVRSTWYGLSGSGLTDANAKFQPGHSHRVTAVKQWDVHGQATGGGAATLTDSTRTWVTNQFAGGPLALKREYYVTLHDGGLGGGQTKRIISNTGTVLTVDSNWTTAPDSTSLYEIWSYNVRGLLWGENVAFAAHAIINFYTWEGSAFTSVGGIDMSAYLKPGGTYVQFPWHVKSKVVGRTASVAVWKAGDPETAYGTANKSGSFTIPGRFETPGQSGLYMGHMDANDFIQFTDLSTTRLI